MGTIALTIKRKDPYVEVVEGGGAEGRQRQEERGEDAEKGKVCEEGSCR